MAAGSHEIEIPDNICDVSETPFGAERHCKAQECMHGGWYPREDPLDPALGVRSISLAQKVILR